jgi:hypothetical protein
VLTPPIKQNAKAPRPRVWLGIVLDTVAACPPLTAAERAKVERLKAEARRRLESEAAHIREAWIVKQARRLATRTGRSEEAGQQSLLLPNTMLPFGDPELEGVTVGDVLDGPETFVNESSPTRWRAVPLQGEDPAPPRRLRRLVGPREGGLHPGILERHVGVVR